MQQFIAKHQDQISGVLSGFDRLVFRGTLRSIAGEYFVLNQKRRALEPLIQALSLYQSLKDHGNAGIAQTLEL